MKLTDLNPGQTAVLQAPEQLSPVILRLMEMGMTPGAEVTVTRRAPLGDPLELQIRGTRLCLRRAEASRFNVTEKTISSAAIKAGDGQ